MHVEPVEGAPVLALGLTAVGTPCDCSGYVPAVRN